uniref:F-box protein 43 n=1 Tax=Oryzias melastigma TaxID=30732 RepID=A0A3B3CND3_ORYME
MTCTPESNVYLESHKHQDSHDCSDSGYSGFFQSPRSVSGVRCGPSSPAEFSETPKENLKLPDTPKERAGKPEERSERGSRETLRPSAVSWCETPRSYKRDGSLRHRLLMCKEKNESARSPTSGRTGVRPERWLSSAFDSLEITSGGSWSTSALEQDLPLSGRKRRLLFTQARTSTLKDGKIVTSQLPTFDRSSSLIEEDLSGSPSADTPSFFKAQPASRKEHFQSPANKEPNILSESSGETCAYVSLRNRSACEDSGFGSLTLDKSQDSLVDHDGSFQELLLSASRRNRETPNLADGRQRSRLPRQHRLSTLKEGGSQSEEELLDRKHQPCFSTTPSNSSTTSLGLVHSMCQQKLQMSAGQSPSLKEELKFTAALVRTPLTFRTTMPLAGLIGRKMGLAKVDILTELKRRNLGHILTLILAKLDSESLGTVHICDAETRTALLKRSALKILQAQSRTSSFCTPQLASTTLTPLDSVFLQIAKTLFHDESLRPCPRCQHPARCHAVKREGVCSRADCSFKFCTSCLCMFHGSRECGSQSMGRRKKDSIVPGSAQSKRNVKRL